jgi:protein TonB
MGEGKNGVIIPDSLKNTPSQTPANSFQTTVVPEEISRNLIASKVDPEYPPQALQQRLDGTVVLQVWVSKDGSVQDLKLVKGYILLGRSAVDAIRQWRFKPYAPNGNPMEFQTSVTVNFKAPR